jgi:hypothetical protein
MRGFKVKYHLNPDLYLSSHDQEVIKLFQKTKRLSIVTTSQSVRIEKLLLNVKNWKVRWDTWDKTPESKVFYKVFHSIFLVELTFRFLKNGKYLMKMVYWLELENLN